MVVIYDDNERPRVVVQGFGPTHPFAAAIEKYSGMVDYHDGDRAIRWESRDALISLGEPSITSFGYPRHLRVIQIGGTPIGREKYEADRYQDGSFHLSSTVGEELVLPDELEGEWRELARTLIVPKLKAIAPPRPAVFKPQWATPEKFTAFVEDLDGYVFAMRYRPPMECRECLYLPEQVVDDITPWLLAAFKAWALDEPDVFPTEPDWVSDPVWMTPAELDARAQLDAVREEAQRVTIELEQRIATAEKNLAEARDAGDAEARILLTGTGTPLVDAVEAALVRLGFSVRNMDNEGKSEKHEDLRVSVEGWTAIAEVKGYTSGGKPSDLQKIERFSTLYALETRALPSARWYIVNQFRERDPGARRLLMQNHPNDLQVFADAGGSVIDTRDLFLLDKAVAAGFIAADEARRALINAEGRFELPAAAGGQATSTLGSTEDR